jgi:hypothetical protein
MENAGAAPMWNKCHTNEVASSFTAFFIASHSYRTSILVYFSML